MADFNFDNIDVGKPEWPKRGRKPKPLPEQLVKALHDSFVNETVPHLVIKNSEVVTFSNLLSSAGKKLNMRIERHIEENVPQDGYSTYHFRARSKRNKEL